MGVMAGGERSACCALDGYSAWCWSCQGGGSQGGLWGFGGKKQQTKPRTDSSGSTSSSSFLGSIFNSSKVSGDMK